MLISRHLKCSKPGRDPTVPSSSLLPPSVWGVPSGPGYGSQMAQGLEDTAGCLLRLFGSLSRVPLASPGKTGDPQLLTVAHIEQGVCSRHGHPHLEELHTAEG